MWLFPTNTSAPQGPLRTRMRQGARPEPPAACVPRAGSCPANCQLSGWHVSDSNPCVSLIPPQHAPPRPHPTPTPFLLKMEIPTQSPWGRGLGFCISIRSPRGVDAANCRAHPGQADSGPSLSPHPPHALHFTHLNPTSLRHWNVVRSR